MKKEILLISKLSWTVSLVAPLPLSPFSSRVFDRDFTLAALAFLCSRLLTASKRARAAIVLQSAWRHVLTRRHLRHCALAKQIAEGIHKLHLADIPTPRAHSMADELRILHERLHLVARTRPAWARRLEKLAQDCDRLGASVPAPRVTGIHRDFYPAQVLVDGTHLYFLDFDLFCRGDPALDVGNFLGHVIEQSLRTVENAQALAECREVLKEHFVDLSGDGVRAGIEAYTTLTLVRHIYLSTQFPERHRCTEPLLELCEERLALQSTRMR